MDPVEFVKSHPVALVVAGGVCVWVSLCLIARMWIVDAKASFAGKLFWSGMLLVPLFGWVLYSAFYEVPSDHNMPLPPSNGV